MDCTGKRIAFTGIASNFSRSDIHSMIVSRGGKVVNSVNSKTDLLIVGENPGTGQSKRDNASKLGIPTVLAGAFASATGAWAYGEKPSRTSKKKKPAKVSKEVTTAIKGLSRQDPMPGFVGF